MTKTFILLVILVLVSFLASCASIQSTPLAPTIQGPTIRVREVGEQMLFNPDQITFTVGQRVKITFVNEGTVLHGLRIQGLSAQEIEVDWLGAGRVSEDLRQEVDDLAAQGQVAAYALPGHSMAVEFTPTIAGTFDYFCPIPTHTERGSGELIVR